MIRYLLRGDTLINRCKNLGVPIIYTKDINSKTTINMVKQYSPDVIVSLFTMQIYKNEIINTPKYGSISSHPSILPNYRGLEVFFWVLANDEKETGVSVFFLAEKIDAGKVIAQERLLIEKKETVESLYGKITTLGADLLIKAIRDIDQNTLGYFKSEGKGTYYPMPTRGAMKRFRELGKKFY